MLNKLLLPNEMSTVLNIQPTTLLFLTNNGIIPHTYIQLPNSTEPQLRFNPSTVAEWLCTNPDITSSGTEYLYNLHRQFRAMFPDTLSKLKTVDTQIVPRFKGRGYSLSKVKHSKYGFLYYVRYIRDGKLIPSRWNTHTNNHDAAALFAKNNRERILGEYDAKRSDNPNNLYLILETYYQKGSERLADDLRRGRSLSEKCRIHYHLRIKNSFIPYLREKNIKTFNELTPPVIAGYQTHLLRAGNNPQTANRTISGIKKILDYLVMEGLIAENNIKKVESLKVKQEQRGCHELEALYGVFRKQWRNELSYMLCLLIYTTGLRNSEIERLTLQDIVKIDDCYFLNITKSKSFAGIRRVPLHPFVLDKILSFAKNLPEDKPIFAESNRDKQFTCYNTANVDLGTLVGMNKEALDREKITYYSGRHYWKTLMNTYELGDIEEVFMGHAVSSSVTETYNHRDKQGRARLIRKAEKVFSILDETLLKGQQYL